MTLAENAEPALLLGWSGRAAVRFTATGATVSASGQVPASHPQVSHGALPQTCFALLAFVLLVADKHNACPRCKARIALDSGSPQLESPTRLERYCATCVVLVPAVGVVLAVVGERCLTGQRRCARDSLGGCLEASAPCPPTRHSVCTSRRQPFKSGNGEHDPRWAAVHGQGNPFSIVRPGGRLAGPGASVARAMETLRIEYDRGG